MKKMLLLAIVMMGLAPAAVAEKMAIYVDNVRYVCETVENGVRILNVRGDQEKLELPSTLDGKPVTEIGGGYDGIFYILDCDKRECVLSCKPKEIIIPDNGLIINKHAFQLRKYESYGRDEDYDPLSTLQKLSFPDFDYDLTTKTLTIKRFRKTIDRIPGLYDPKHSGIKLCDENVKTINANGMRVEKVRGFWGGANAKPEKGAIYKLRNNFKIESFLGNGNSTAVIAQYIGNDYSRASYYFKIIDEEHDYANGDTLSRTPYYRYVGMKNILGERIRAFEEIKPEEAEKIVEVLLD